MPDYLFNGWQGLGRTAAAGVLSYAVLLLFLRISGKRTLAKMNAFDFIVTVALGSTLATILLNKNVALAEGALAFAMLIGLQFVVAWLSARSRIVQEVVKSEPALLLRDGKPMPTAMLRERVTESELEAAVRKAGYGELESVDSVILETDGTFSVIADR